MTISRLLAAIVLAVGACVLASQMPSGEVAAQDTKAEKKALRKKLLEERLKAEAEKAKSDADKAKADADKPKEEPKQALTETKPANPMNVKAVAKFIDSQISHELTAAKIAPSPPTNDAEFLRRASLDITGVIPTAERVASFLANTDSDKRANVM